ncbi:MAG: ArnT family glycosyltransferase [Candidatus Hodarchaeales archaeon]|jgi:hypothetical protein
MLRKKYLLVLFIVGLFVSVIGIGIHCSNPAEISSLNVFIDSGGNLVKHYELTSFIEISYQMNLRIDIYQTPIEDYNLLLLNETEYDKFIDSGSSNGLIPIIVLEPELYEEYGSLSIKESLFFASNEDINLYLVFKNNKSELMRVWFYTGIIPSTYYLGLVVMFIGVVMVIATLIFSLSGWKKYFFLGTGINFGIFLIGIGTLGNYNTLNFQFHYLNEILSPELYNDFQFWYMQWIEAFLNGTLSPYTNEVFHYQFPPLFYYTLGLFALIPIVPSWKTAIPIFLYHVGTGILVYLISKKITNREKTATIAMLFYYLNPLSLIYASFLWFNPTAFIFFVVLAFYLILLENKNLTFLGMTIPISELSLVSIAIGTMYKQFAAIFLPLIIIVLIRQREMKKKVDYLLDTARYMFIYFGIVIILSLPFLIINFDMYTFRIFDSTTIFSLEFNKMISYSMPVNFNSFFVVLGLPDAITDMIGYLIINWVLMGVSAVIIYLICWSETSQIVYSKSEKVGYIIVKTALFWALVLAFSVHFFYPRGAFKFYLLLLVPFISIFLDFKEVFVATTGRNEIYNGNGSKRRYLMHFTGFFILLLLIVLISRYVYFLLLIIWLLVYLVLKRRGIRLESGHLEQLH